MLFRSKKIKNYYSDVQTEDYPLSEATIEIQNIIKLMKNLHLYFSLDDDLDIIEKHIEQPLCNYYFRQLVPKFQEYYDALKSRGQIDVSKTHLHFDKKNIEKQQPLGKNATMIIIHNIRKHIHIQ